ncbi:MAG: Efflux transporter, family, subunit [Patescibacteria group bacterium]|jgi:multidrug efflux pump subunit AcrA (membrane-fusion protein)|nr:Efflux transporter, family, subunit [Patescibacteria group bacterium]
MQRIYQFFRQRKKTTLLLSILLLGAGILLVRALSPDTAQARYVLEVAEQGTLATSVSGTGQVQGEAEIEVKPEVSGKVTQLVAKNGQQVAEGDVIAVLDAKDAQKTVRDAKISLESAQIAYDKLMADPDTLSLLQAENALAQAERTLSDLENSPTSEELDDAQDEIDKAQRSLDQAERNLSKVQVSAGQDLESASENGYNTVVEAFADITGIMTDLSDFIGTEQSEEEYIGYYNLMADASYTEDVLSDYETAQDSYDEAWAAFQNSSRDSSTEEKTEVISLTLEAAEDISNALNSDQILLNRIEDNGYSDSAIAEHIDEMMTTIPADVVATNGIISSLQSSANTLEETDLSAPNSIADAEDTVEEAENALIAAQENYDDVADGADEDELAEAEENVAERAQQLADLTVDVDSLDVRSQKLSLESAENKYSDALEELEQYTIRAPLSGTVASMSLHVGETASSGSALAIVVADQFTAQLTLNEVDVAKVAIDDRATLTFDAVEELTTTGKIVQIDTIGTVSQGVVSYNVLIALDTEDERVLSGMSANISIITDIRQNVVVVSSSAVKSSGTSSYVEVLDGVTETGGTQGVTSNTSPRKVTVEVGLSNDTQSEIISGISAGDYVVTRTITDSATKTTTTSSASSILGGGGGPTGGFGGSFPQ